MSPTHVKSTLLIIVTLAFPADIGSQPALPVRESRQCLHAGIAGFAGKPACRLMKHGGNMAAPVSSVTRERYNMASVAIIFTTSFFADIGSKPASLARPASGSRLRLLYGESRLRR